MRTYARTIAALLLGASLVVGGLTAGAESSGTTVTVDFESLPEGSTVTAVSTGAGISGPVDGSIAVFGRRRAAPTTPAAMVFDGACEPGGTRRDCTGGDSDLFFPDRGNLLIVSEDGDAADPDDAEDGLITFDFTTLDAGSVRVESIVVADTDLRSARIAWVDTTGATGAARAWPTGDNRWRRVDLGIDGVVELTVDLGGAGAVDDLRLTVASAPAPTTTTTAPPATTTTLPATTTTTTAPTTTTTTVPAATTSTTAPAPTTSTTTTTVPATTTTTPATGPAIGLATAANGQDAGTPPGPLLTPGEAVTWAHTVTNTGDQDLWSLIVWHEGHGRADCPTRTLRIGDSVTCTVTGTADLDRYDADVSAFAYAGDGTEAADEGTAGYTTIDTGTTTTVPPVTTTTLPGSTTTTTSPPAPVVGLDMATAVNGMDAGTAPGPQLSPGEAITWAHTVTNTGTRDLYSLIVWHNGRGRADCPTRTIRVGEAVTCTVTATADRDVYQAGVDATAWAGDGAEAAALGTANYATVPVTTTTTTTLPGGTTTTTTTLPPVPGLSLEILVDGTPAGVPPGPAAVMGGTVTIDYVATNTGGTDLWALWMWDPAIGRVDCPERALPVGASITCTRTAVVAASYNTGEALARTWDGDGAEIEDVAGYHFFGTAVAPDVSIQAYVEGWDADHAPGPRLLTPGDTIHFSYVVTNTGQTPLTGVAVDDSRRGAVDCPQDTLAVGEAMTCYDTDVTRWGNHAGTGTVTADAAGTGVSDSDPYHWHTRDEPRIHDLRVEVSVNRDNADTPPGPTVRAGNYVTFRYSIVNAGNTWENDITIEHPGLSPSDIQCTGDDVLNAGQTLVCMAIVPAQSGQYAAEVEVFAWDNDGRRTEATDPVHYFGQ
ncbi:MAG: hypothetical protein KQH83_04540 [Actinobacteria bacterium]|nr:hypothetical protein [Actinomycetota bacterium]